MGEIRALSTAGDTKVIWDCGNDIEVKAARKMFKTLKGKDYRAYSVKKSGKKGGIVNDFDPDLEMIIMVPPIVGG